MKMRGLMKCIGIAMLVVGIGVGGAVGKAQAIPTPAISITTPSLEFDGTGYTLGFRFHVLSSTTATQLGVYDSGKDGLANPATVGIWSTTGIPVLLVSGIVPTGTGGTLDGFFRYVSIAPFSLPSGVDFFIGSNLDDPASSLNLGNGGSGSINPNVVIVREQYSQTGGFSLPGTSSNNPGGAWLGANFKFDAQAVPEPGTWLLLAAGLVGLFGYGWRRKRAA